ncbi:hypothetical protein BJQ89_00008 [Arthrobacter sp. ES1]|nr:hypothetical protein [Arthrobacter sp. ES1]
MNTDRTWQGCVFIGTSLDGYIARPDGDLAWLTDPSPRPHTTDFTAHPALVWESFEVCQGCETVGWFFRG